MVNKICVNIAIATILFLSLISITSADLIVPGEKKVDVTNVITNMNDFQDYYLLLSEGFGGAELIEDNGIIIGGYSIGYGSIYAIKKDLAEKSGLNISSRFFIAKQTNITTDKYLESIGGIKLAENILRRDSYPTSSPIENITYQYTLEIGKIKTSPDSISTQKNVSSWTYLAISLIALIIIFFLIIRRKNG